MSAPLVAVVGSVHMDLIAAAPRLPRVGETMPGSRFSMHPGGKGGNQAIQVARMGVRAAMIARLGDDDFGRHLLAALQDAGVDCTGVALDRAAATGASTVLVGAGGDYASIIVPGAAALLSAADLDRSAELLASARVLMLQLELPLPITIEAARRARAAGVEVLLNAAPAPADPAALPDELWSAVTILLVNSVECGMLSGMPVEDAASARTALRTLVERHALRAAVVTLGEQGALAIAGDDEIHLPAHRVAVVDTVGAGDAFAGALAAALASGDPFRDALPVANAAGALAVTRAGAATSLPTGDEIHALLTREGSANR